MAAKSSDSVIRAPKRPTTLTAAVVLAVAIQVIGIPFMFVPGTEDTPLVAIVLIIVASLLTVFGAWGMWNLHRWGAILALVITGLNTLASIPGFFNPPSGWILASVIIFAPLSVIDMVLIVLPSSWRALGTR